MQKGFVALLIYALVITVGLVVSIAILVNLYADNDTYHRAMDKAILDAKELRNTLDAALIDAKQWRSLAEKNSARAGELEARLRSVIAGFGEGEGIFRELIAQTRKLIGQTGEFGKFLEESGQGYNKAPD